VNGRTYDVESMWDATQSIVLLLGARIEDISLDEDGILDAHDDRLVSRLLLEQQAKLLECFPAEARAEYLETYGRAAAERLPHPAT
jgi:hypothetical protein